MYRAAVRSILSELVRQDRLKVCDDIQLDQPRTKLLAELLLKLDSRGRVLIVTAEYNQNLTMAARNMKDVEVREVARLDPVGLVSSESILFSSKALRNVENFLQ
jgi:large subunit ribosomal protein L4